MWGGQEAAPAPPVGTMRTPGTSALCWGSELPRALCAAGLCHILPLPLEPEWAVGSCSPQPWEMLVIHPTITMWIRQNLEGWQ